MDQEKAQVLSMLEAGKLTPEQADRLLAALEGSDAAEPTVTVSSPTARRLPPRSGGKVLSPRQIARLAMHGVDADFVRELRAELKGDLDPDQVIDFAVHHVTDDFVRKLRALKPGDLDAGYIRQLQALAEVLGAAPKRRGLREHIEVMREGLEEAAEGLQQQLEARLEQVERTIEAIEVDLEEEVGIDADDRSERG